MKNTGYEAWKARLNYMQKELPFTDPEEGIVTIKNEEGRLHADNEPAWRSPTRVIWYRDGRKHGQDADIHGSISYYFENIRIPPHYFTKPESLTVEEVLSHQNAEVRYVGMKAIGMDKVLKHKKSKIIHRDEEKDQVLFQITGVFDEPVSYVKVVNSTQEPDGSYKDYYLCVPPTVKTCAEAVAWTFGFDKPEDYHPEQET